MLNVKGCSTMILDITYYKYGKRTFGRTNFTFFHWLATAIKIWNTHLTVKRISRDRINCPFAIFVICDIQNHSWTSFYVQHFSFDFCWALECSMRNSDLIVVGFILNPILVDGDSMTTILQQHSENLWQGMKLLWHMAHCYEVMSLD